MNTSFSTMESWITTSATNLARVIREKKISSLEVVDACLARIEEVNPLLNAVVQVSANVARQEARKADEALSHGARIGALHGVPMTIKDSFDTAGLISTAGTQGRRDCLPSRDATVVARLRAAGAILLGKTNTPELTFAGETDNLIYGRTNNPYQLAYTPAGSSGGAAAIVAAGGSPFDIGSDTGGSIRVPAHFCGIAGIKPTAGRVPRTGHIISFDIGAVDALTHIGPMARYVEDLILILPLIAGPDGCDPAVVPVLLGDVNDVELKGLRVAFYADNGLAPPGLDIIRVLLDTVQALSEAGLVVEEDRPVPIQVSDDIWWGLYKGDGGKMVRKLLREAGTKQVHPYLQDKVSPPALSTAEYAEMLSEWAVFRSEMLSFFQSYDLIICPVSPTPALPHGATTRATWTYITAYNLTGWPAVVLRCGTSDDGLPVGVQIVARPWREDVALAVAQYLEEVLGGWQPPPI